VQTNTACFTENKVALTFELAEIGAEAEEKNEHKISEPKLLTVGRFNLEMILIGLNNHYFNKYYWSFIKIPYVPPEVYDLKF
jgi:hypothetical protein